MTSMENRMSLDKRIQNSTMTLIALDLPSPLFFHYWKGHENELCQAIFERRTFPAIQYIRCLSITTLLVVPAITCAPIVISFGPANYSGIHVSASSIYKNTKYLRHYLRHQCVLLIPEAQSTVTIITPHIHHPGRAFRKAGHKVDRQLAPWSQ